MFIKKKTSRTPYINQIDDNLNGKTSYTIGNNPLRNRIINGLPMETVGKTNINEVLQGYNLSVFYKALRTMRINGYCVVYLAKSKNNNWVISIIDMPIITTQDENLIVKDNKGNTLDPKYTYILGSYYYPELYKAIPNIDDELTIERYYTLLNESVRKFDEFSILLIKDELMTLAQGATPSSTQYLKYVEHAEKVRSNIKNKGLVVVGSSSDLINIAPDLTSLDILFDKVYKDLSMAFTIPFTKLFGESASGLNTTGEGDRLSWYDQLLQFYTSTLKPFADFYTKIVNIKTDLIFIKNAQELKNEAEARAIQINNLQTLILNGLISKEDAKKQLINLGIVKTGK